MNRLRRMLRVRQDDGESEAAKRCGKGMAYEYDQDGCLSKEQHGRGDLPTSDCLKDDGCRLSSCQKKGPATGLFVCVEENKLAEEIVYA